MLYIPMLDWSRLKSANLVDSVNPDGTTVTASATANTKGAWVELSSSCPIDAAGFLIMIGDSTGEVLFDIGVGTAGSEKVILPNVHRPDINLNLLGCTHPAWIPIAKGARIAARCQASAGSLDVDINLVLIQQPFKHGFLGRAVDYGADTTDSGGTVIDPGATANTKGAWTEIAAASAFKGCKQLLVTIGHRLNEIMTSSRFLFDIGIGAAGSEKVIVPDIGFGCHSTLDTFLPFWFGFDIPIIAGTRVAVRGQCDITDATDRLFDFSMIGVY